MTLRNLDRHVRSLRGTLQSLEVPQSIDADFGQYRDDPVGFVKDVLGADSAVRRSDGTPYQFEVLEDLANHPRVSVRSGHGVGNTTTAAWAILWFLLCHPLSRVIFLAPEFQRQVRAIMGAEIKRWVRRATRGLPVRVLASKVEVEGFGDSWAAIGAPATEVSRLEGMHSEHGVMIVLDETKGIPDEVYNGMLGALTGGGKNRLLVTSTPGAPTGIFYTIHTKARDDWRLHHLPASDSSLVSPEWVEQRRHEWGEASPLYEARVLGRFPQEEEGQLFRLSDLEAATAREIEPPEDEGIETVFGVDVARLGSDKSAVAVWEGNALTEVHARAGMDVMEVTSWVASMINRKKPDRVRVDVIGIGSGVADRLRQLGHKVEDVNVSARAAEPELHLNYRAEAYWRLREALERGDVALPDDGALIAELSAIRYGFDRRGRIQIESKDEMRKRLRKSPDLADAAVLGFATRPTEIGAFFW